MKKPSLPEKHKKKRFVLAANEDGFHSDRSISK